MNPTTLADVERWVSALVTSQRTGRPATGPFFLRPFHVGILAGFGAQRGANRITIPDKFQGYATRMHLWQAIGLNAPVQIRERDPQSAFFPLTAIRSEADSEAAALAVRNVFERCGTKDRPSLNAIYSMLAEIFGNCFFHAETGREVSGLVCAQWWRKGNLAQVAVVDSGIGIRRSLAANPTYTDRLATESAVIMATELGVTSKPGSHMGYGLALARELLERNAQNFILVSGNEALRVCETGLQAQRLLEPWQGTVVVMEWRTDHALDAAQVYDGWPQAEGESDDILF